MGGVEITENGEKEIVTPTNSGIENEEFVLEDIINLIKGLIYKDVSQDFGQLFFYK